MREIVLDTETTGLDPAAGHRIVEIGAVELQHHLPTGREYHVYLNPEREMPEDAFPSRLSDDFLPARRFADIATLPGLIAMRRVIQQCCVRPDNYQRELRNGRDRVDDTRAVVRCLSRQKFPGAGPASTTLYSASRSIRGARKHGALIDSHLAAAN